MQSKHLQSALRRPMGAGHPVSVEITATYQGGLRCQATHAPSRDQICTDAPVDNHGRGEAFAPTDLVAVAMGTCMLTIMGIVADRHGIDLSGSHVKVEKQMVSDPDRRIAALITTITVPKTVFKKDRDALEKAALTCPVHRSLDARVKKPVQFIWLD